jgi:hypothetical protein
MQSVLLLEDTRNSRGSQSGGCAFARICQGEDDGQCGLHGEVDREDGLLEGGELGARESPVGYNAPYEGLEDLRAEKGAIAGEVSLSGSVRRSIRVDRP